MKTSNRHRWMAVAVVLTIVVSLAAADSARAQVFVPAPVTSFYVAPAPVTSFYAAPAPVTSFYVAPAPVAVAAPAPTVALYGPVVSTPTVAVPTVAPVAFYTPPVVAPVVTPVVAVPTTVRRGLFGRTIVQTPFYKVKF